LGQPNSDARAGPGGRRPRVQEHPQTFGPKGTPCIIGEYGLFAWDSDPVGRSSTANTDLVFLKNGSAAQDTSLQVNTHGNRFRTLEEGSGRLHPGAEYTYDSNNTTLTVTAGELGKYASGGNAGTINLTLHFWSGQIVKYQLVVSGTSVNGSPL
jgi:hypothetical protein